MPFDPRMKWFRLSLVTIFLINSIQAIALPQSASVSGQVVDDLTSLPISDVQVTLVVEEATILSRTDVNGNFRFDGIAPGTYTLRFVRDTYQMLEKEIDVARNLPALTVSLKSRTVQLQEILVTPDDDALANLEKTTDLALSEARLDEKMGITIADTLSDKVGIAQWSMRRAVARPVIRGMGGDRLLILEDGERTGDKSASAADHAVAIDPSTAKNIKVIRGPASLIYGSNTLGGVVNVKRETIPQAVPNHPTVDLKFQSESVNSGIAAITGLTVPVGDFAWRLAWNRRYANDTHTPVGVLENTSLSNTSFSSGASVVKNWGHVGVSRVDTVPITGFPGHRKDTSRESTSHSIASGMKATSSMRSMTHILRS